MKIDIGSDGKILGTKRVSANGQVSGFTEYAGQEVLVILPGGHTPVARRDARDVVLDVERAVQARMRTAFHEYKHLKARFESPQRAAESFLKQNAPKSLQNLLERADRWIKEQVAAAEERVESLRPRRGRKR